MMYCLTDFLIPQEMSQSQMLPSLEGGVLFIPLNLTAKYVFQKTDYFLEVLISVFTHNFQTTVPISTIIYFCESI